MPSVKEIYSKISDVTIDADTINLNTDTVESLLSTVQTDIALIKADMANGVSVNGTVTATQSTAASLKAQAQLLNSAGTVVDYAMTGSAGTPATDVVSVQGIAGATAIPVSGTVNTYPAQGTTVANSNFTSITSATLASAVASREVLTVHNEGAGMLYINVGSSVSTTSYQVRLLAGDYWEAPAGQQSLQHSGIFGSAGTARVTEVS